MTLKTYKSDLKGLLHNRIITCIPPLFYNKRFITDLKEKLHFLTLTLLSNALYKVRAAFVQSPVLTSLTGKSLHSVTF